MKRTLIAAACGILSLLNVASAKQRDRGGDCDRPAIRSSRQFDRWQSDYRWNTRNDVYRDDYRGGRYTYDRRDDDRSTAASVGIVAGSAAGGAAIGGLAGGMKGAAIGAIAGGAAGLVYDQATRDGDRDRDYRRRR
jgi:hypothetical protein